MKVTNKLSNLIIRLLAIVMCISILVCTPFSTVCSAEGTNTIDTTKATTALTANGYTLTHENEFLQLYCALSGDYTGTFAVLNKADGSLWYSNPLDAADDPISLKITDMQSILIIKYRDMASDSMVSLNSKMDCIDEGGLNIQKLKKGLRFNFTFPSVKIKVPFTVLLNDDGTLTAKVEVNRIQEKSENKLFSITMLPYFCAATKTDKGFIFVPDGSGAVMNLNNGKVNYGAYNQPIYGGDAGEIAKTNSNTLEKICMPVYGLQKNSSSVFTVVTQGAAQSSVYATVSEVESNYNVVYNEFNVRKVTNYTLDRGWQGSKTFNVYQETKPSLKKIENKYFFLSGNDASISGMAKKYREYLKLEDKEEGTDSKVYVDYLGSVVRKKSVLGFPVNKKMVATSFDEALKITKKLVKNDVTNLNIRYLEWDERSVESKYVNDAVALSNLGGEDEFLSLAKYAKKNKIGFFPDVDLISFSHKSYPLQQYFWATQNMNKEINTYYPYKLNLYMQDTSKASWYTINYNKLAETSKDFDKAYKELGIKGLSLSRISNTVTSDYSDSDNEIEPWLGAKKYTDIIKREAKNNTLMLDAAFIQNAVYAKHLVNIPESSGFDMLDYEVPFYQMVISGAISYCGTAINLEADHELALLKVMQTGGNLHYSLTYHSENEIVRGTLYDSWIGTDYAKWVSIIAEQNKELNEVYSKLGSNKLVGFKDNGNGLTISYFEGGGELWINNSNAAMTVNGAVIEAKSYLVQKGRGVS